MGDIVIEKGGVRIELNFSKLAESLSREDRMNMASALCWDEVMQEAIDRLAGQSEAWSSTDSEKSFEFLKQQIVDKALQLKFHAFSKVRDDLRDMFFESRLYWKLYHDETLPEKFDVWAWLKANGFEGSNYTDVEASALADSIVVKIEAVMRKHLGVAA